MSQDIPRYATGAWPMGILLLDFAALHRLYRPICFDWAEIRLGGGADVEEAVDAAFETVALRQAVDPLDQFKGHAAERIPVGDTGLLRCRVHAAGVVQLADSPSWGARARARTGRSGTYRARRHEQGAAIPACVAKIFTRPVRNAAPIRIGEAKHAARP